MRDIDLTRSRSNMACLSVACATDEGQFGLGVCA